MRPYHCGVLHHDEAKSLAGLTLIAPMAHEEAFLIDNAGSVAHRWSLPGALDHAIIAELSDVRFR